MVLHGIACCMYGANSFVHVELMNLGFRIYAKYTFMEGPTLVEKELGKNAEKQTASAYTHVNP